MDEAAHGERGQYSLLYSPFNKKQQTTFGDLGPMKFCKLASATIILISSNSVNAAPLYYALTGQITYISDDYGVLSDDNIQIGDSTRYVWLADSEAVSGQQTLNDGTISIVEDYYTSRSDRYSSSSSRSDYFYADLLEGQILNVQNGGVYNDPSHVAEYNYGYNYSSRYSSRYSSSYRYGSYLQGGSQNANVQISKNEMAFSAWEVGAFFYGRELVQYLDENSYERSAYINLSLTLDSITSEYPQVSAVPVPAAIWLFGSGLIGLVGLARRKNNE